MYLNVMYYVTLGVYLPSQFLMEKIDIGYLGDFNPLEIEIGREETIWKSPQPLLCQFQQVHSIRRENLCIVKILLEENFNNNSICYDNKTVMTMKVTIT